MGWDRPPKSAALSGAALPKPCGLAEIRAAGVRRSGASCKRVALVETATTLVDTTPACTGCCVGSGDGCDDGIGDGWGVGSGVGATQLDAPGV